MTGGIDHGPCLLYWRLSYRRKFIRTVWLTAVTLPVLVGIILELRLAASRVGWVLIGLYGASIIQAVYTYYRWQMEVRGPHPDDQPRTDVKRGNG